MMVPKGSFRLGNDIDNVANACRLFHRYVSPTPSKAYVAVLPATVLSLAQRLEAIIQGRQPNPDADCQPLLNRASLADISSFTSL